jgi:hypothetical protein
MSSETKYDVLWPRGRKAIEIEPLATRADTLEGKTICELWDGLFRGDEYFPILREGLSKRYPGVKIVPWTEFPRDGDHGFPDWQAHPDLLSEKGADMVIVGTGA